VRKLGLDDNQQALLEIAKQPTPKTQLRVIEEIVERKLAVRNRASAAAADKKTTGEISTLEAGILEKEGDLKNLKRELATNRTRLQEIRDKLVVQGEVAGSEPPSEEQDLNQAAAAADSHPDPKVSSDVTHDVNTEEVVSPATTPTGNDIPAFLDRHPMSPEDEAALDVVMTAWTNSTDLRAALVAASPVVREHFIEAVREDIASVGSGAGSASSTWHV